MITKRNIAGGDDGDRIAGLSARYLADLPAVQRQRVFSRRAGDGDVCCSRPSARQSVAGTGRRFYCLMPAGAAAIGRPAAGRRLGMYRQTGMKKPSISRHGLSAYMAHRQPPNGPASPARCKNGISAAPRRVKGKNDGKQARDVFSCVSFDLLDCPDRRHRHLSGGAVECRYAVE